MEVLFSNVSVLEAKEIKALTKIGLKNYTIISYILFPIIFIVFGGITCIFDLPFGIILITFGILVPLLFLFIMNKQNKFVKQSYINRFDFTEEYVDVDTKLKDNYVEGAPSVSTAHLSYAQIYKLTVSDEYLFLFINKQQAYVINKETMLKGDVVGLIALIASKGVKIENTSKRKK